MKKLIILFLLTLAAMNLPAQQKGEVMVEKEDGTYTRYFSDAGKVSTLIFWDKTRRNGYAVAYNTDGKEVYRSDISRMHGSRTVRFKYHANGVVREAHFHWQPDGGIQSGGSYTYFDEKGNKSGFREEIDPMAPLGKPSITRPNPAKPAPTTPAPAVPKPPAPKQEIVEEAPIYQTRYYIVNRSRKPVRVVPLAKTGGEVDNERAHPVSIPPGDTLQMGMYINAGFHEHPANYFDFRIETKKKSWLKKLAFSPKSGNFRDLSKTEREYYLSIEPR